MYGGTITGCDTAITITGSGNASSVAISGGNITGAIDAAAGTVNLNGGKIGGLNVNGATTSVSDVTLTTLNATAGLVNIQGNAKIGNLTVNDCKVIINPLTAGANIAVTANGVFTEEFQNADAANAAKVFITAAEEGKVINVVEKTLSCDTAA